MARMISTTAKRLTDAQNGAASKVVNKALIAMMDAVNDAIYGGRDEVHPGDAYSFYMSCAAHIAHTAYKNTGMDTEAFHAAMWCIAETITTDGIPKGYGDKETAAGVALSKSNAKASGIGPNRGEGKPLAVNSMAEELDDNETIAAENDIVRPAVLGYLAELNNDINGYKGGEAWHPTDLYCLHMRAVEVILLNIADMTRVDLETMGRHVAHMIETIPNSLDPKNHSVVVASTLLKAKAKADMTLSDLIARKKKKG